MVKNIPNTFFNGCLIFALVAFLTGCDGGSGGTSADTTPPTVMISASENSVLEGGMLELTVSATESAIPSISCDNGATVSGDIFTAPIVDEDTSIICTASATDASSNTGSATVMITVTNESRLSSVFPKEIDVFGVKVFATADTPDIKVMHTAKVLAEYLDNDEDGSVDNQALVDTLVSRGAAIVMSPTEDAFPEIEESDNLQSQFGEETIPNGRARGQFDTTLEEVLHLVTHVGYANLNDDVFGERIGSVLADAMDIARGGQFTEIPDSYPADAWYTYDDETCDYECMVTEYFYWGLTSILGAQDFPGREEAISEEWDLNTASLVEAQDPGVHSILTDLSYALPDTLPNGMYDATPLQLIGGDGPEDIGKIFSRAIKALPGHKIAYGDERRIWMMNPDGSGVEELADGEDNGAYVSWGPNAEYVYFASSKGGESKAWQGWRVNALTKELMQMTDFDRDVRSLGVSPDNKFLAISIMTGNSNLVEDLTQFNTDLYIITLSEAEAIWNAGEMIRLADMDVLVSSSPEARFWYEELHWNPVPPKAGEFPTLAYTKTWRYDEDDVSYTHAYTIKADGSAQTLIKENADLPIWDFSGTLLVFADLSFFDFNDQQVKRLLVSGIEDEIAGAAISPDGQFIVFEIGDENRRTGMARMSFEAGNSGVAYPNIIAYEPKWSPRPVNSTPPEADENVIGAASVSQCMAAGDMERPACFIVEDTQAKMNGIIDSQIGTKLTRLINEFPQVTTIVFGNVPGSEDDAANFVAGRQLFAAGFNTRVEQTSQVSSGGVDLFLAGVKRTTVTGAQFGVHSWEGDDENGNEIVGVNLPTDAPEHSQYIAYYTEIGVNDPAGFYFFTLNAAGADEIHIMTTEELTAWGFDRSGST